MTTQLESVTFEVPDPHAAATIWAGLLDRTVIPEPEGILVPGTSTQVGLRFTAARVRATSSRRLHLHLASESPERQQQTIDAAIRLGGRHIDVGQEPDAEYVVLADPVGTEMCVIDAGNDFLAGTGFLGEVACDGSREVGLFWSDVLSWPLIWDHEGETSVQSPSGGTKVSWGGAPVEPKDGRNPQSFDLVAADPAAEVQRLRDLGARILSDGNPVTEGRVIELADPDGNEFRLRADR